ncbi:MAG TPA: hypothetical protein VFN10_09020 [Thermoanaerobaculia bacterium]|nr:hypothetical protein [Thermoanaerobaculia bacterium]
MKRLAALVLFLLPTLAFAQDLRTGGDWVPLGQGGCIGGSQCKDRRLRLPLADRPVVRVRFEANDQIGNTANGRLRLRIDGNTVRSAIDIPRQGQTFTYDVDELRGQALIFETETDDEVQIGRVAVMYARENSRGGGPRHGGDGGSSSTGWRRYSEKGCIGGSNCKQNGNRITIALEDAPVLGVRFYAHDNVGTRADGRLNVRIDDHAVASYEDVARDGKRHEYDVDSIRGAKLVIQTATDDEVEIRDIEVLYGRGGGGGRGGDRDHDRGHGGYGREVTDEGGCIGGEECGGKRNKIRIPLRGRAVSEVRFYARDDVGTRAGGELRVRIDGEILRDFIDIPREGRTFTVDARGLEGDYLIIEPAADDEVVVKDVRVRFED